MRALKLFAAGLLALTLAAQAAAPPARADDPSPWAPYFGSPPQIPVDIADLSGLLVDTGACTLYSGGERRLQREIVTELARYYTNAPMQFYPFSVPFMHYLEL